MVPYAGASPKPCDNQHIRSSLSSELISRVISFHSEIGKLPIFLLWLPAGRFQCLCPRVFLDSSRVSVSSVGTCTARCCEHRPFPVPAAFEALLRSAYRLDMLMDSCILVRATSFQVGGTVIEIHPKEIKGSWDERICARRTHDFKYHDWYNEFGHPEFDTVRSPLGELVYRLKYRGDKGAILSIVEAITGFMKTCISILMWCSDATIKVATYFPRLLRLAPSWPRPLESPLTRRPLRNQSPRHK